MAAPHQIKKTPELLKLGNLLFDNGASQIEVARTLKITDATVRRWFPGRKMTPEQTLERIKIAQQERWMKKHLSY